MIQRLLLLATFSTLAIEPALSAGAPKPLRALLITGGCCHNYPFQAAALTNAVAKLAAVEWTIVNEGGNGPRA